MSYSDIKISTNEAEDILFKLYNLKGIAHELPGEVDFNFKIEVLKEQYILKISRPNENVSYLDFQTKMLQHIEHHSNDLVAPRTIPDSKGTSISEISDKKGNIRKVRLLTWIAGRVWSSVNPQLDQLRFSLGEQCGKLTKALHGFDHIEAHREFVWDIKQSLWTKNSLHLLSNENKEIVTYFQNAFEASGTKYNKLRKSVVHNDANDNNVIVSNDLLNPVVLAAIDYGDAIHTQIINDLAIACSYAIMDVNDPLEAALPIVSGYHSTFNLLEEELEHLYNAIAMRLIITVTKSAMNKISEPDNEYLLISEKPAWDVLKKWYNLSSDFVHFSFRKACGFPAHPNAIKFNDWAIEQQFNIKELFPTAHGDTLKHFDLSVSSTWLGHTDDIANLDLFQYKIDQLQKKFPNEVFAGGYLEPRVIYTSSAYDKQGNSGTESRTVHLGLDFWFPANTPVHALFDGEVVTACNDAGDKEYGGLVILKHEVDSFEFFTLYGHNTVASAMQHQLGDIIKKGEKVAELGDHFENGNWAPHLHFQIMLSMLDYEFDFPGVAYPNQLNVWKDLCPNPNLIFKSDDLNKNQITSSQSLIDYRKDHLGKSLSLQYKEPLHIVRGSGVYLIDTLGRKYLDTVNNVAHVGHEHITVVRAGQEQMAMLNTNSRYLHENINDLAQELLETLPSEISVLHFVNSGSEANELAIRMVKAATGEKDIIASEVGYHGNTNMCVDISSYKFDGKGGNGAPEHTHIFPLPDTFRGKYRDDNSSELYTQEVRKCIKTIHEKGRGVGAFIIEPIISCGGQVELPKGFLKKVYGLVREAGGLCISDEVQVGCGRVGKAFWGFQLHNVVPDIVTIGKPLGNGHPIAAVACTQEVADKFANGMEYFNTFGGNPVSCAIGIEVLQTINREKLQQNALEVGEYLKSEIRELSKQYPIIGDVRGQGLFLGIELVDKKLNPLADHTDYIVNRMKDHGVLMSIDGSDHNVIKIKPPMVFSVQNAKTLITYLRKVLTEDFMTL